MTAALFDPGKLPDNLPPPSDDGATKHLVGLRLPSLPLRATDGGAVDFATLADRTVVYVYPRTGRPGQDPPEGWAGIPGAWGCSHQSCSFRDHFDELKKLGVAHVFGLSTQDTEYQREAANRFHLPFPILSDANFTLTRAINLPTFTAAGMILLCRMALVVDAGVVTKVFYPVFPPDKSADEVVSWLRQNDRPSVLLPVR